MTKTHYKYVIIGAGLSGLSSAYELSKTCPGDVLVLEKEKNVGGLAKTVHKNNCRYDLGSHRIHINPRDKAFELIKELCEGYILKNVRRGKLRLKGSYIDYPISSVQMFRGLGVLESALCAASFIKHRAHSRIHNGHKKIEEMNYESYLIQKAGGRAYRLFYEPYARKVWGCNPSIISTTAVKKRISMLSPTTFIRRMVDNYRGSKNEQFYFYIRGGIGVLAQRLSQKVKKMGCKLVRPIQDFHIIDRAGTKILEYQLDGRLSRVTCEKIISTIPINEIVSKVNPPESIREAYRKITWRDLRLVYVHVEGVPKTEGETFYFPEAKYLFGRVSVPMRYDSSMQDHNGFTSYVCEVPCHQGDGVSNSQDKELFDACYDGLKKARIITHNQTMLYEKNFILNVPNVYPVYIFGWENIMRTLVQYLSSHHPNIYLSGKLGFFLHCNLDHAMEIGLLAAESVLQGKSSREWNNRLHEFHAMKLRD